MLLPLTFSSMAIAQNDFQKIFDDFQKANQKEFEDFRDRANAEYSDFLRNAWVEFSGKPPVEKPKIKPIVPPVVIPEVDDGQQDKEIKYDEEIIVVEPQPVPVPVAPIEEVPVVNTKYLTFSLYGTDCKVRYDADKKLSLYGVDENSVADFWDALSSSDDIDNLLYDLMTLRQQRSLCDWAFYKFSEALAQELYGDDKNAATVFHAYVLTQAGFRLKLGYSKDDKRMHLIAAVDGVVFEKQFWRFDGSKYYLLDNSDISVLKIADADFKSSSPMRLTIDSENLLDESSSPKRSIASKLCEDACTSVSVNMNLLSFYEGYPSYSSDENSVVSQWITYANTPLSQGVRDSLYAQFRNVLAGKTQREAAEIILNFVQTGFVYKYDEEIWGRDRSFFAEESLYYPYCDCEDRSILFSHLIRDLLGLDVALLYSPGHLFTAVHFSEEVPGSYIMMGDRKFIICEPTYTRGAPVGRSSVDTSEGQIEAGLLRKIEYEQDYTLAMKSSSQYKKSLFPVCVDGKWGYRNSEGEIVVPCEYDSVSDYEQGDLALYAAKKDSTMTLFHSDGVIAYERAKGYIPVNVKDRIIGGALCRGDYHAIVKFMDDRWVLINVFMETLDEDFRYDEYEMDDVTYQDNIYSSGDDDPSTPDYKHYAILRKKSDQKYGVLCLGIIRPDTVIPFIYDKITFKQGDKSTVLLYQQGEVKDVVCLDELSDVGI